MKIYIVIQNEMWDGETWDLVRGAFYKEEDAKAEFRNARNSVYDDWKDDTIDEDSDKAFYAYRDGCYSEYHINLYIEETELY